MNSSIELSRFGLAYRKAKADLYYSSDPDIFMIADYEDDLHNNLLNLKNWIDGDDESWAENAEFIGGWSLATKAVDITGWDDESDLTGLFFSSPAEKWEFLSSAKAKQGSERPTAEFRLMANCSMQLHVLSALWILEVGHLFDEKLQNCAYGNRLRRKQDESDFNDLSLGSFSPYLKPFRDWRDNGLGAVRTALDAEKKVIAITADVKSFYHELNASFMLEPDFVEGVLGLDLNKYQLKLNRLFVKSLSTWADLTPLRRGLPVGLPASALIANVALYELDRVIEQQIVPLHYGRYVDDILLVIENKSNIQSPQEVWEWIFSRTGNLLGWNGPEKSGVAFRPKYLNDCESKVEFSNKKNKVFIISGDTGKSLINTITQQIQERASEWRGMPRLPNSASHVGSDLLSAIQSNGEAADNLQKADLLTMRRAEFAVRLRDFEAYERDLDPIAWKPQRKAFFSAFIQHVLVLPQFFNLAIYLPRVVRLATACEDFDDLRKIITAVERLISTVEKSCSVKITACEVGNEPHADIVMDAWHTQLFASIHSSICAAFPPNLSSNGRQAWNEQISPHWMNLDLEALATEPHSVQFYIDNQARLFSFDLAHIPFRFIGLKGEVVSTRGIPKNLNMRSSPEITMLLPHEVISGSEKLSSWLGLKTLPNGFLFATRPFNLAELSLLDVDLHSETGRADLAVVVLALRGFQTTNKMPWRDTKGVLRVSYGDCRLDCRVAVSSWHTSRKSWEASVKRNADEDVGRYCRINRLIDQVISEPNDCRYFVLPELALPARWFMRIALKLQSRGISLITGIEYQHANKSEVRNQIWASLIHDGLGFPSIMIYQQDKQKAALHEEEKLHKVAGLKLIPQRKWEDPPTPPIIQHGELRFAMLVCSELTNVSYRASLPGEVDALFVPEWNRDIETFNPLVESAALDIHAFIIQCNDREYGDSRIRAPFKEAWKRDVLRIKGGMTDYFVTAELSVTALRQFQDNHRSPSHPFKPVPDGFVLSANRKSKPALE